MTAFPAMRRLPAALIVLALTLAACRVEAAPTLFRIFMTDGTDVVSYGE